jgi:hypothetical protein
VGIKMKALMPQSVAPPVFDGFLPVDGCVSYEWQYLVIGFAIGLFITIATYRFIAYIDARAKRKEAEAQEYEDGLPTIQRHFERFKRLSK